MTLKSSIAYPNSTYRGERVTGDSNFIYVMHSVVNASGAQTGAIRVFKVDGLGNLTFMYEENDVAPIDGYSDGDYLYVASYDAQTVPTNTSGLIVYSINKVTGVLTRLSVTPSASRFRRVWKDRDFIYVAKADSTVYVYKNDGGNLTLLDSDYQSSVQINGICGSSLMPGLKFVITDNGILSYTIT
jgi:WD40 repeat protein